MNCKRGIFSMVAAVLLALAVCPSWALAAEAGEVMAAPAPATVYPAEVRTREENGTYYLEKVYCLSMRDDPAAIPTGDLEREGRTYTLLDIIKTDQTETDARDHIEVITLDSDTKDMAEIIKGLEPELEVSTEDGYTGILTPDYTSITVEAAGYKTTSRTVSATRSYPSLSNADTSFIPKTIEDGGRTLTLADVKWQEAGGFYNATASYSGTATGKSATGYTVTVDYAGEVTKTSRDTVIYTAVFASHGETQIRDTGDAAPAPSNVPAENEDEGMDKRLLLIPVGLALLAAAGYGGWRGIKYYKNKKRGYV